MTVKWDNLFPGRILPYGGSVVLMFFIIMVLIRTVCGAVRMSEGLLRGINAMLLVSWVFMAGAYTLFGRGESPEARMELQLFWCIKRAWMERNPQHWYFIVGNILLFVPLGLIIALIMKNRCNVLWVLLFGFLVSLCIEVTQLYTRRGLFELDDLFHNTLGCYIGYCIFVIVKYIRDKSRKETESSGRMFYVALISAVVMVLFFGGAAAMGQPVFDFMI